MTSRFATARACSNIALIKYWGNRDNALRLPANPSISFNLATLYTETTVSIEGGERDGVELDGAPATGDAARRVTEHLDLLWGANRPHARVRSHNNFPMGAGIASSAAAFAALTVAACAAMGHQHAEAALSALARRGSGSASRSVPGGYVAWRDESAYSIASAEHWPLVDVIGVVSAGHKKVGSTEGHALAPTSPLQAARVADAARRFEACQRAVAQRDFAHLADLIEEDALMMHGVMMTSTPSLMYFLPGTMAILHEIRALRERGVEVAFTIDAGPNVHCICAPAAVPAVEAALRGLDGVRDVLTSGIGGPAQVIAQAAG
ncbi:MAG: diphosphomevalonate decarboxylase [Thermoflexales bacterium]|nr:diphosphomevalonate decarboxylase [Thermoflexales bacterium]